MFGTHKSIFTTKCLKLAIVLAPICAIVAALCFLLNIKVFLILFIPVIIFMFRSPEFAFHVTAASTVTGFMFYFTEAGATFTLSIPKIFGIITMISLIINTLYYKKKLCFNFRILIPLTFIIVSITSLIFSSPSDFSGKTIIQLFGSFLFYFMSVNIIKSEESFKRLLITLSVAYGLISLYSIIQYFLPSTWTDEYNIQAKGGYQALVDRGVKRSAGLSHPGVFSFILIMLFPYLMYMYLNNKHKSQILLWIPCIIICSIAILLSHTRATVLALMIIFILFWLMKIIKINILTLTISLTAAFCIIVFIMPDSFSSKVFSFTEYLEEGSVKIRLENQKNALELFIDNPVFGVGVGNFEKFNDVDRPVNKEATNMLLEIAAEIGIIGLLTMIIFLAMLIRDSIALKKWQNLKNKPNIGDFMIICIIVTLWCSMFMSNQDFREWWMFMSFPAIFRNMRVLEARTI